MRNRNQAGWCFRSTIYPVRLINEIVGTAGTRETTRTSVYLLGLEEILSGSGLYLNAVSCN